MDKKLIPKIKLEIEQIDQLIIAYATLLQKIPLEEMWSQVKVELNGFLDRLIST